MRVKDGIPSQDVDHVHNVLIAVVTLIAISVWAYVFVLVARLW